MNAHFILSRTAFFRTSARSFSRSISMAVGARPTLRSLPLMLGAAGSVVMVNTSMLKKSPILNDAAQLNGGSIRSQLNDNLAFNGKEIAPKQSWLQQHVNYQELCIGSITGLFLGIIAGKLSSAIVFLTLAGYFLTQFLESRGIVTIPWRKVVSVGKERIDVKSLVLEQSSFKVPFVLTFLIAAYNV